MPLPMKQRVINGITVLYDEKDLFSVENAVYVMKFPESGRFYYGSTRDPSDRIHEHCTHINSHKHQYCLINKALKKEKKFEFHIIATFDSIEKAQEAEKKLIHCEADRLYRERKRDGKFSKIVHESMLNTQLYRDILY